MSKQDFQNGFIAGMAVKNPIIVQPKIQCSTEPIVVIPPVVLPETTVQINNSQIQCSSSAALATV